ncbi:MAG: hypothetical protein SGILL_000549 [Bacillariaceae sp.]
MATTENGVTSWKHIGLHGHSVGTFSCLEEGIQWKSALYGRDDEASRASTRNVPSANIGKALYTVFGKSGYLRIQTKVQGSDETGSSSKNSSKLQHEMRFDGFPSDSFDTLKEIFQKQYEIEVQKHNVSAAGTQYGLSKISGKKLVFRHCVLEDADEEGEEFEVRKGDEMMSLDLAEVSQCVLPGNNRNELEIQWPESDAIEANNDQLVSVRFYIPPDQDVDPSDKTEKTNAELLQQRIMQVANVRKTTGDVIVEFDLEKGSFLTPRGRYSIELCKCCVTCCVLILLYTCIRPHSFLSCLTHSLQCQPQQKQKLEHITDERFFRMRGNKYDYRIRYDDISRLFLLPKPDDVHMAFVIALDKPIRQGQQRYQYLVLQTNKDPDEVHVNLDEETIKKEYGDDLQPVMKGSFSNLIAKTFKVISKKKVFIPGKFTNANQQPCVKCALRANEGLLYPLEKQFVFIHKPPVLIRFNEVESVEFERYAGGQGSTRNFDLRVSLKASATGGAGQQEYTFSGIDRSDYAGLYSFLSGKNMRIKNLQEVAAEPDAPVYNEDEIYGGPDEDGMEEESEDEDYDEKAAAADKQEEQDSDDSDADSDDSDDFGSEIDDDLDSDLEEARGVKKKDVRVGGGDTDDEDSDDDMIIDDISPKKKKRKRSKSTGGGSDSPKKKKAKKDPNAPKKALNAYMLYAGENRARIKAANPDAKPTEMSKLIGEAYKSISAEEKAELGKKVALEKERYAKEMKDYSPSAEFASSPAAKKKKAKAKKDPNAPKGAKAAYMWFSTENREKVKAENPDLTFGQLGKALGEKWKAMDADDKAPYEEKAKKDKERYKNAMAEYNAKKKAETKKPAAAPADSDGMDDHDDDDDDSDDDDDDLVADGSDDDLHMS